MLALALPWKKIRKMVRKMCLKIQEAKGRTARPMARKLRRLLMEQVMMEKAKRMESPLDLLGTRNRASP